MIKIDDEDIKSNHALFLKAYKDAVNVPLTQEGFMRKTFPKLAEKANRTYPYEVRIPKSISEMLAGDFEPARRLDDMFRECTYGGFDIVDYLGGRDEADIVSKLCKPRES